MTSVNTYGDKTIMRNSQLRMWRRILNDLLGTVMLTLDTAA